MKEPTRQDDNGKQVGNKLNRYGLYDMEDLRPRQVRILAQVQIQTICRRHDHQVTRSFNSHLKGRPSKGLREDLEADGILCSISHRRWFVFFHWSFIISPIRRHPLITSLLQRPKQNSPFYDLSF